MTKDEALDLALYALELEDMACRYEKESTPEHIAKAITAIKQARALDKMAENARELGLDYEPVTTLFGSLPVYDTPPVQEDWGPGPHECHSLTASVQEPVAWRYRGILHDFDPSDWAEGPVTPLYTTPTAQPAPVQEPVAFFDPQGKGFYWAKPTKITAPVTVDVEPLPLYTIPPAAQRQWVGLTDEEILKLAYPIRWQEVDDFEADKAVNFAQAIEAKLKEKNT